MYDYQPRPLPIGPPSAEPSSTVGPSVSMVELPSHGKRVDFSISHYARKTTTEEHQNTKKESLTTQPEDR